MFCNIAFNISWLHLYSTNIIIVKYNGWWFQWTNPTWMPNKLHHPAKPYTSNQTHSRDASCEAIISEWLVDIATRFCFVDIQEKAVPPCKKTKPVCEVIDKTRFFLTEQTVIFVAWRFMRILFTPTQKKSLALRCIKPIN